ncbi:MAG: branched-chain amino acid aminotransferase [Alphaproteobacteria bacterium]|nr:branched-chain amino acid aminotransferase [Alphaproteobacteria bacterium]MCB1551436.1 branched-chain amino acid aminotransferase [Alphaproteobacteria bacterium]MCB9984439.1 branched-chain amino acid aminotransferase [Micavibrio sp.]HPQ50112.1 branched-chain amino acid aminotransferase [Alphaproteobacteria bacterium]
MALIPFDDRDGFIWFDGQLVPWRDAKIHVITHGLHYGSAIFEGERAYEGTIFKSKEHTSRLFNSANILGMSIPFSEDQINAAKEETLKANHLTDAYIRPVAWRGSEQMGIAAQATKTHVAIACWEWPSYFSPELREKGISLKTSPWKKPAPDTAPCHAKAAGLYMINTLSKHMAEDAGFVDALMLDYRGYPVEATGANLFRIKDGVIRTPKPDCFLNGLTRQTVMSIAQDLGYPLEEDHITLDDLHSADEVFITGTAAEVTAIGKIDDTIYSVGSVTRALREAYENLVRGKPYRKTTAA